MLRLFAPALGYQYLYTTLSQRLYIDWIQKHNRITMQMFQLAIQTTTIVLKH